jgi:hypothetical protein
MKHKIRINQGRVLPAAFRWLLSLVLLTSIAFIFMEWRNPAGFVVALLLSFSLFWIWSSFFMLEVEASGVYREYILLMGRRFGEKSYTPGLPMEIFVNTSSYRQGQYAMGSQQLMRRAREYRAYLKFDSGKKLLLISSEDAQSIFEKAGSLAGKLGVPLIKPS